MVFPPTEPWVLSQRQLEILKPWSGPKLYCRKTNLVLVLRMNTRCKSRIRETSYGAAGGVSIGDTLEMEGKKCQRGCKERIARIWRLDIKEWEWGKRSCRCVSEVTNLGSRMVVLLPEQESQKREIITQLGPWFGCGQGHLAYTRR